MLTVLTNADFYVGDGVVADRALLIRDGVIDGWGSLEAKGDYVVDLEGQTVAPGFIDLQVNGGGDVLLNDEPTPSGVAAIAAGHRRVGTTDIMPTFITGPVEDMRRAAAAVATARETDPGVLGVHFEGPMLSPAKLGVHDPRFVRGDDEDVLQVLVQTARNAAVGKVIVTLGSRGGPRRHRQTPGYSRPWSDCCYWAHERNSRAGRARTGRRSDSGHACVECDESPGQPRARGGWGSDVSEERLV